MKKVAVIQSNYIPWKGYFDIINDVDLFIFHDDLQYTKNDWRNRNVILTPQGPKWITIPVGSDENRLICEVKLPKNNWQKKHWNLIKNFYSKSLFFHLYKDFLEWVYLYKKWDKLSDLNQYLIKKVSIDFLGIRTEFKDSRQYSLKEHKLYRLIELLKKCEADIYISGPKGRNYIDDEMFRRSNIEIVYKDYSNYPEYKQTSQSFYHSVTILDVLFNCGSKAPYYIWGWRESKKGW